MRFKYNKIVIIMFMQSKSRKSSYLLREAETRDTAELHQLLKSFPSVACDGGDGIYCNIAYARETIFKRPILCNARTRLLFAGVGQLPSDTHCVWYGQFSGGKQPTAIVPVTPILFCCQTHRHIRHCILYCRVAGWVLNTLLWSINCIVLVELNKKWV